MTLNVQSALKRCSAAAAALAALYFLGACSVTKTVAPHAYFDAEAAGAFAPAGALAIAAAHAAEACGERGIKSFSAVSVRQPNGDEAASRVRYACEKPLAGVRVAQPGSERILAARQAAEACGERGVKSVRTVSARHPDGGATTSKATYACMNTARSES